MITEDTIWEETKKGNLDVLNSPFVDILIPEIEPTSFFGTTETPLHHLASMGVLDVLKHPSVDKAKDWMGRTPLHILATKPKEYANTLLNHPSVDKVLDAWGKTPLHNMAEEGLIEVLEHPSIDKIYKILNMGKLDFSTPLHYFVQSKYAKKHPKIVRQWALKKYPWFPLGNRSRVTTDVVDKILNTQNAEKFILDICK